MPIPSLKVAMRAPWSSSHDRAQPDVSLSAAAAAATERKWQLAGTSEMYN